MEYVKSNKGGFKLLYNNYMYVKQKVLKNGAVCWECHQRRNKLACKAKLPVLDNQIIKVTNVHIQAVIDYFEDTYIGRLRPGGHRVPLFDLGLWNMYNQTLDDLPRTNNAVEGWHRSFQANVGAYHPNFWKFIHILKREQNLTQVNIAQV